MRLLRLQDDGRFSLVEYIGKDIPLYAILSHTWGNDEEEVNFKDLMEGTGTTKPGYKKLTFCGEQAARDGLRYFWVDTCCIDKSSSAELTESINSMFQWYHQAAKCYVLLTDVPISGFASDDQSFHKSRWFTRGWTLQELVAPKCVEFFSAEGERLGSKGSMIQEIHDITGISIIALQGAPLSRFGVDERMSWAQNRKTKREEDAAYSLLGIFEISLPLIYGEGQKRAFTRLRQEIKESTREHAPDITPTSAATPHWNVPFRRNRQFVGRESYLRRLENTLFTEPSAPNVAITGLGGVGKTQIVLELAYRTRDTHKDCSVFWIPAINSESLQQAFIDIGEQLRVPGIEEEQTNVKKLVQHHLSNKSAGQWLLIVDNIDDMDIWNYELREYLPQSQRGRVVFTTRSRKAAVKLASAPNVIEVSEMGEETAMQLLSNSLIHQHILTINGDKLQLLEQLTFLPLAIAQAAAYINENGITLSEYLLLLYEQEQDVVDLLSEEFEDDGRYENIKNPVATTWLISFEQIRRLNPLATEYLSFMSCVAPKDIPQSLLPPGSSRKKEVDAIGILNAYSFAIKRAEDGVLDVHRLVHLATRNWLRRENTIVLWTTKAIKRLEELFPEPMHENRSVWRLYLTHARYLLERETSAKGETVEGIIELAQKFALCLYSDGRYNEAEQWFVQVMDTRMKVLGEEHPDTLTSISDLASTYSEQGRWAEGAALDLKVMEMRKRVLGEEHPDTLTSISNLALTYGEQGRWKEAEALSMQVIEKRKRVLGEEHLETLASLNNLALAYCYQGRWTEAEPLQMQVMETSSRVVGEDHPNTLTTMSNLASTYWDLGRWKEAEVLEMQVMETRKKVLGEEHPDTLVSMNNLAFTLMAQDYQERAILLMDECSQLQKQVLGPQHSRTKTSLQTLEAWCQGS